MNNEFLHCGLEVFLSEIIKPYRSIRGRLISQLITIKRTGCVKVIPQVYIATEGTTSIEQSARILAIFNNGGECLNYRIKKKLHNKLCN